MDNLVTIKVITSENGPRVLPGARKVLSPTWGRNGELYTGIPKEDLARLSKELNIEFTRDYWHNFAVTLTSREQTFDTNDALNELKVLFLKNHPWVAKTDNDITQETCYIIYDEAEKADVEAKKFEIELDALTALKDMDEVEKAEFLTLYGVKTSTLKPKVILMRLREKAVEDPKKFNALYTDPNRASKVLIEKLIQYEIIRMNGSSYYYGDIHLGGNLELAVEFLKEPKHQDTLIGLKKILEEKKKAHS